MKQIGIIDYGMGNIQCVANALEFLGYTPLISSDSLILKDCNAYILPGVGAFSEAMNNLIALDLVSFLTSEVMNNKKPILGICLGMQLMMQSSEEMGHHEGLGWIEGSVIPIPPSLSIKVPHVGWNTVKIQNNALLFDNLGENPHFYFDHSFHVVCDSSYISAYCMVEDMKLTASLQFNHIFATQFHPEKSQTKGLKLLRNYLNFVERLAC